MKKKRLIISLGSAWLVFAPPVMAQELGDGVYQCQGGLTTSVKALDRQWTPVGAPQKSYEVIISGERSKATIAGVDYECRLRFFEFLGCSTGFYHFAMNINTGRFTHDESYGFIRGETPGGDAEPVTTTLGYCTPLEES
ncbi:MAG: hypothetical protein ACON49_05005 [Candidatus Puniceispirillaceae bacterium]